MKEEVKRWWKQTQSDIKVAKDLFKIKNYDYSSFWCQQAAEKALKALLLKKINKLIKTHDLVILGRRVHLRGELLKKCEQLSRVYVETKYGTINSHVPSQKFKKRNSSEYLKIAAEVTKWVEKSI